MRITAKVLNDLVDQINVEESRPLDSYRKIGGKWVANVGHLQLDHNSIYGGYQLQEISNESGGVDDRVKGLSWGHRLSNKEMYYFLLGVLSEK